VQQFSKPSTALSDSATQLLRITQTTQIPFIKHTIIKPDFHNVHLIKISTKELKILTAEKILSSNYDLCIQSIRDISADALCKFTVYLLTYLFILLTYLQSQTSVML